MVHPSSKSIKLLKTDEMLVTDAWLNGWNPWENVIRNIYICDVDFLPQIPRLSDEKCKNCAKLNCLPVKFANFIEVIPIMLH